MPTSVSQESQNSVTPTNENKTGTDVTWNDAVMTWDEATGTWNNPGQPVNQETKNSASVSNESLN